MPGSWQLMLTVAPTCAGVETCGWQAGGWGRGTRDRTAQAARSECGAEQQQREENTAIAAHMAKVTLT